MLKRFFIFFCLLTTALLVEAQSKAQLIQDFETEKNAKISLNRATGNVGFIRLPGPDALITTGNTHAEKSRSFLTTHSNLFSINDVNDELVLRSDKIDNIGLKNLTFEQYYHGVPVFDGKLRIHFNKRDQIQSVNGVYIPNITLSPTPVLSPEEAAAYAVNYVNEQVDGQGGNLEATEKTLYVFRKGLVQGIEGPNYLAFRVTVKSDLGLREFVFIDAHKGGVVEQFTGTHGALFRRLYEANIGNQIWQEGDPFPDTLDQWQQNELEAAGHTYYLFQNTFGYTSYDGLDAEMLTINNNPAINCPNASWNGSTANYCTGVAADDVVAHEWGHAYTEFTSGLIYAWQSGALNESYSDIWGETVDLLNNYEDAGEDLSVRGGCGSSHRWLQGEDASAFGGALRDMWSPTCFGDPGKVTDSEYYCSSADFGGVHHNSGVNNHAYSLLVDGGTYNGETIVGLGFVKSAHIFWRSQSEYLTATSNFIDQADALEAAANDLFLAGTNLEGISTTSTPAGPSGEVITALDLIELGKVLIAVEMRVEPTFCNFTPLLTGSVPPPCATASSIFFEDFEAGLGIWTITTIPTNPGTWKARDWEIEAFLPQNRSGSAAFAVDPINGDCETDLQNGILRMETTAAIVAPGGITQDILMRFDHFIASEQDWDGGNIKYSLNGGPWTILPAAAIVVNPYNGSLKTVLDGNDNPLAGEEAYTGTDEGSTSGSWGSSQVNLSSVGFTSGNNIKFRFELGTDGCNGRVGWYVDDIWIYECGACASDLIFSETRTDLELLFEAANTITSDDVIEGTSRIFYSATQTIDMLEGFNVEVGAILEVLTDGCDSP